MDNTQKATVIDVTHYLLPFSILMFGVMVSAGIFFGFRSAFGVSTKEEVVLNCDSVSPLSEDCLRQYARDLDTNEKKFDKCILEGEQAEAIDNEVAAGEEANVLGTPSLFIGKGKGDEFQGFYIGSVMTQEDMVDVIEYAKDHSIEETHDYWYGYQLQLLADFEGQVREFYASDQGGNLTGEEFDTEVERVISQRGDLIDEAFVLQDLSIGDGIVDGKGDVVLMAFSDFECPYCAQLEEESLNGIKEQYVDSNEIRFVFRDFPLDEIHPNARLAAQAARCFDKAGGDYFEYHDLLFEKTYNLGQ
ncbi:thioredoxin domain-containing protein [Candidatus Dojkabacteria bacterium]|uniref:Thioredoxin domain-containing protein n=1 Tax=Candidatus Dojkabacteria bacterium TaxID=2099670 RepID=A0A955L6M2_9BACT|nr:thioredoxin domain-containing protein [Candidatus Dojkabacteria bacterium]